MNKLRIGLALCLSAALLAACGGGGSDTSTATRITSVKVFGDSLADVGTFGFKFTVQASGATVYPERVAQAYGINSLCPYYLTADGGATFTANPTTGCTGFAVGGGRINAGARPAAYSIPNQLATAGALGNYSASDLLLIVGGGNDAADLVGAYLGARGDSGAAFVALAKSLVPEATANAILAGANPLETLGGAYMTVLADTFHAAIKTHALDKGATHVVLLNLPGITNTPRFQMVLDSIAAASGGGTAGATARAQAEGLFKAWMEAFNAQLAAKVSGNASVVLVDFYKAFNDQIATPAQYGLQDVKTPACPITGVGGDGLPTYTFPTCSATALSGSTPPTGATGGMDWWKSYAFSDSFHPTPYGHQLVYQRISLDLAAAGRL
jgi:phospholipase/lecithinase/hemolysin